MRWAALLRWGIGGLVTAVLLTSGGCVVLDDDTMTITAELGDTAGLFEGNDVGILGVTVGKVTNIEPRGNKVAVEMRVETDLDLPRSVGAVVVARSVATDRYVELTPTKAPGPRLKSGATIPLERTRTPVEFDELLASLQKFTEGLAGPEGKGEGLQALLAASANVLDGQGAKANQTVQDLAASAKLLSSYRGDLEGTITDVGGLAEALANNAAVIEKFINNVTATTSLFKAQRRDFGAALTSLSKALRSLATLVRNNREELGSAVTGLTDVADQLLARQESLSEAVEVLPLAVENLGRAVGPDQRLDVRIPPEYFSPAQVITGPLCDELGAICDQLGTSPDPAQLIQDLLELLGGQR